MPAIRRPILSSLPLTLLILWALSPVAHGDEATGVRTSRKGAKQLAGAKEKGVWHFAIFGDRTGGPPQGVEVLRQAVGETNLFDPDLVMTVGDLVEGYNSTDQWLEQTREFQGIMNELNMPWYPVAGNHDIYWRGPERPPGAHEDNYEKHFGPLWYWFAHKETAFIVLYTDEGDPADDSKGFSQARHTQMSAEQRAWLGQTLTETREFKHTLVFLHHPRWIKQSYRGAQWDKTHTMLAAAGNVRGVFAGHIHRMHYAGKRDGIEYFALATTGGVKSRELPQAGWVHHFNIVTVRDSGIRVVAVPVGKVIDPREVTPERRKDLDRLLSLNPRPQQPIILKGDGSTAGSYRLQITNPTQQPIELTLTCTSAEHWRFHPDHFHASLQAGEKTEMPFAYERTATSLDEFPVPRLQLNIDYLAETTRITLPEKELTLQLQLASLSADTFVARDAALTLDGVSSLQIPHRSFDLPDGAFTLEGWVYPLNLQGRRPLLAKSESSEFCIFASNGKPSFSVHFGRSYVTAEVTEPLLQLRRWQHVAGVFDGQELRLYLNGKKIASARGGGKRTRNRLPFYIGADPDRRGRPANSFRGQIDEVRLSRGARYQENFTASSRFEPDPQTVLLYHLDKQVGPFAPDHSPSEAHGRLLGKASCAPRR